MKNFQFYTVQSNAKKRTQIKSILNIKEIKKIITDRNEKKIMIAKGQK